MFNQEAKIRCRIGDVKTSPGKDQRRQFLPCVFIVPLDEAGNQLDLLLQDYLNGLEEEMANPHIQGKLLGDDDKKTTKYKAFVWGGSDNDLEQAEHYRRDPLTLEGVSLGRFTAYPMSDYNGSIGIKMHLSFPYRSEELAGKVDKLAGEMVRMQIAEPQTSFKSDLKTDPVEEPQPA